MKFNYINMEELKNAKIVKLIYCKPILLYYKDGEFYIDEDYYYVKLFV